MKNQKLYFFDGTVIIHSYKTIPHGLYNHYNKWIGYKYQDKKKGFGLQNNQL